MQKVVIGIEGVCLLLFLAGCQPGQRVDEPHKVAVQAAEAPGQAVSVDLPAAVAQLGGSDAPGSLRDYRLTLDLAGTAQPAVRPGGLVKVKLPTVHNNTVLARVERVASGKVELLLDRQVQELDGRQVQVTLPLDPAGLCLLPFGCLLAPMGTAPYVFVVEGGKARKVPAVALGLVGDDRVLVAAPIAPGQKVVVQGIDNLLDGDDVKVLAEVAQ